MVRNFFLLAVFLLMVTETAPLFGLTIRLPKSPEASEQIAAKELSKYFEILSGEKHAVVRGVEASVAKKNEVHLGKHPQALAVFGLGDWSELKPDEVLYQTDENGDLWVAGEGRRGTLYAVYELLEQEYGCRFFAADDELIPVPTVFSLPPKGTSHRYAPPSLARCASYQNFLWGEPSFRAKLRSNFDYPTLPDEWGGCDQILGHCHTFQRLIGTKYFNDHPEWFALVNGRRACGSTAQLCLSNAEMRRELTKNVLDLIRSDNGRNHIYSVSQNDNEAYCTCKNCNDFVSAHGNQTDLLIDCVNEVADAVAREFPKVYIATLAYRYTRTPPKTIRPRANVGIQYCTIEAASFHPLESSQNGALYRDIAPWRAIAHNMLFWNYLATFTKYYLPHPNWQALAQDIRLFRDCRPINIFEQGACNVCGRIADLGDLRIYLTSRLLWNPDLDEKAVIREFCEHYYGPAAPAIYSYLRRTTALAQNADPPALDTCYPDNPDSWLPDRDMAQLWKELYSVAESLRGDSVYGLRIAIAALPMTMALLERPALLRVPPEERLDELREVDPVALVEWCKETLVAAGAPGYLNENGTISTSSWRRRFLSEYRNPSFLELPASPCAGELPPEISADRQWWSWNVEDLASCGIIGNSNETAILADDSAAVGGKAVRMPATHGMPYLKMIELPNGVHDVYLTVRCDPAEGKSPAGDVILFGNNPAGPTVSIPAADCAGPAYKLIHIGRSDLGKAIDCWCAPIINDTVSHIWIDRIICLDPTDADGKPLSPEK